MPIIKKIAIFLGVIFTLLLSGCKSKPTPNPDPNPDPDKPKWEDYYPLNWYKPLIDWSKAKWIPSDHSSDEWSNYVILIAFWNDPFF